MASKPFDDLRKVAENLYTEVPTSVGNAIPTCPCCGGRHTGYGKGKHENDCELKALLVEKEEK